MSSIETEVVSKGMRSDKAPPEAKLLIVQDTSEHTTTVNDSGTPRVVDVHDFKQ